MAVSGETSQPLPESLHTKDYTPVDAEVANNHTDENIHTRESITWQGEAKQMSKNAAPIILSSILEYSLSTTTMIVVGRLGTTELGAASLGSMIANFTAYNVYHGLATGQDSLCAQAYGSGAKHMVAVHFQRMTCFLLLVTIPIIALWSAADIILPALLPTKDPSLAILTSRYLQVVAFGAPAYAMFESSKRYMQAQGVYTASFFILLICSPINAFMNWFLVWNRGWGFIGAPIALALTDYLLLYSLFLYVYLGSHDKCWTGFTWQALCNWGPMVRLAFPGLLSVQAESLAYGANTLVCSYISPTVLATQTVLSTVSNIAWQVPFSLSLSVRAPWSALDAPNAAQIANRAAEYLAIGVGVILMIILWALRSYITPFFTTEPAVIKLVVQVMPLCAAAHFLESMALIYSGVLCGIGRQDIAGYAQTGAFSIIALPIGVGTAFGLGWHVWGLWIGALVGFCAVVAIEWIFLRRVNWQRSVEDAKEKCF
ncbi:MATE efflux family protein [Penicillium atrosanguineum]|nr:MATE efflux family protein [Penicillium atrosanguineum]